MKKILSISMALIMAACCFGITFTAQADDSKCVEITLDGTSYNSSVQQIMNNVNTKRQSAGLATVVLDNELTEIAKLRALESMLYVTYDANDQSVRDKYRPDGSTVDSMIPSSYGSVYHDYFYITDSEYSYVDSKVQISDALSGSSYASVKSMGLAIVQYDDTYVAYVIFSTSSSSEAYMSNTIESFSHTADMDLDNANKSYLYFESDSKYFRYNLCAKFYGNGFYENPFIIPNSQVSYSSSKSSIVKTKKAIAYPKKNGKATVYAKTESGGLIGEYEFNITSFNHVKVSISSLKSKKKKTMSAKWTKNVIDASGYQVQYSRNKKFKKGVKTVTVKGKKNASKTIKKLKRKKVYYVRVRVYLDQGNGEKAYSAWSKTKKVKVK